MNTARRWRPVTGEGPDGYLPSTRRMFGPGHVARRLAFGMAALVLLVGGGFIVWNRYFSQASPVNPGSSCPMSVQPTGRLPLASIGIKRVALIGDSIMNQASCSVADSLASVGIQTNRYAVFGSALLSGPVDWVAATAQILATDHPDAVLAVFVGNYWLPGVRDASGRLIGDNTPEFYAAWQQRAVELSNEVLGAGAALYWVSPPPIQTGLLSHAQRLYEGYRSIPGDRTIDAGSILAGPAGQEVPSKTTCGKDVVIRTPDGVHLTDDGARIYGEEIAHLFTAETGLLTSPKPC